VGPCLLTSRFDRCSGSANLLLSLRRTDLDLHQLPISRCEGLARLPGHTEKRRRVALASIALQLGLLRWRMTVRQWQGCGYRFLKSWRSTDPLPVHAAQLAGMSWGSTLQE
jgi:hypothetical protein